MKKILRYSSKLLLLLLFVSLFGNELFAQAGVYTGGPMYKNRSYSVNELKNSGFSYVVIWTIHIDPSGSFNFNAEFPLVQNGSYIGNSSYPNFAGDVASLKTGATSINRVEFALSAWASTTFDNVRDLINSQGTGSNSILYRNFQALKNTFPTVDAISFDDEKTYDANTATRLAVMLRDIGFKVTLCPYTNSGFWTSVASGTNSQRPGTIDRIDLQCYAGGASNNPCNWNFNGIPIYPGLWNQEKTTSQVQSQLTTWKNNCSVKGGFMWLYDDFDNSSLVNQYASAINNVFPNTGTGVATAYKDCNFSGSAAALTVGDYNLGALNSRGILNDDISSIKVNSGYQIQLFEHDNFTGASITLSGENSCLVGNGWNDRTSSIKVLATSNFSQTIQAEVYSSMSGIQSEGTTDAGGGTNVGWIEANDWMSYNSITIPTSGTYLVEYRVASPNNGGSLSLDLNAGSVVLGTVNIPNTGGWQNWSTVSHTVSINAGTYNFGIFANSGGWNINWWKITRTGSAARLSDQEVLQSKSLIAFPNPAKRQVTIKTSSEIKNGQYQIVDIHGVSALKGRVMNSQIDVSSLKPGIYSVIISDGKQQFATQLIKE